VLRIFYNLASKAIIAVIVLVILCNIWVVFTTRNRLIHEVELLPDNEAGLVLGTSKRKKDGEENKFFKYRLEAAAQLYHAGKIKKILVSGDNSDIYYNEPLDMKIGLLRLKVPEKDIILDPKGFRTIESISRCNEVYGFKSFTIITQKFHNHRALFISDQLDLNAVGYEAQSVPLKESYKTRMREYLARTKAVFEMYLEID
jgi:SanA protein